MLFIEIGDIGTAINMESSGYFIDLFQCLSIICCLKSSQV